MHRTPSPKLFANRVHSKHPARNANLRLRRHTTKCTCEVCLIRAPTSPHSAPSRCVCGKGRGGKRKPNKKRGRRATRARKQNKSGSSQVAPDRQELTWQRDPPCFATVLYTSFLSKERKNERERATIQQIRDCQGKVLCKQEATPALVLVICQALSLAEPERLLKKVLHKLGACLAQGAGGALSTPRSLFLPQIT